MKTTTISGVTIELKRGDIANQKDMDAIVNAANAQLRIGGGVAGAIHRAAGPELAQETRLMAPIKPGEAVISGGHNLPNEFVIHCLGPVYGQDKPENKLLANCYSNALKLAEENDIPSVAFPSISTGAFGYPMDDAARVAFETGVRAVIGQTNPFCTLGRRCDVGASRSNGGGFWINPKVIKEFLSPKFRERTGEGILSINFIQNTRQSNTGLKHATVKQIPIFVLIFVADFVIIWQVVNFFS